MQNVKYCSFCFNQLDEQMYLLGSNFCNHCYYQFEFISDYRGKKCLNCEKKANKVDKQALCEDCRYWQRQQQLPLVKNRSLLYYNQFAHEVMEKAKFSGDVEIWKGIARLLSLSRLLPKNNVQVVPSSNETYLKRDYNHLKSITQMLNVKTVECIRKKEGIPSQVVLKDVSRRKKLKNAFEVTCEDKKTVTIFDDVYTTGSTLKDIQKTFQNKGIRVVKTITIFRADLQF